MCVAPFKNSDVNLNTATGTHFCPSATSCIKLPQTLGDIVAGVGNGKSFNMEVQWFSGASKTTMTVDYVMVAQER